MIVINDRHTAAIHLSKDHNIISRRISYFTIARASMVEMLNNCFDNIINSGCKVLQVASITATNSHKSYFILPVNCKVADAIKLANFSHNN
jgi:hypothetical protein